MAVLTVKAPNIVYEPDVDITGTGDASLVRTLTISSYKFHKIALGNSVLVCLNGKKVEEFPLATIALVINSSGSNPIEHDVDNAAEEVVQASIAAYINQEFQ